MQSEGQARGRIKPTSRDDEMGHPLGQQQANLNRASRPASLEFSPARNFAAIIQRGNLRSPPYRASRTNEGEPTIAKSSPVIDLARRSPDEGAKSAHQQESVRHRLSQGQHLDLESLFKGQRKFQEELLAKEPSSDDNGDSPSHIIRNYGIAREHPPGIETQGRPKASRLFEGEERMNQWEIEYARRRPHMDYVIPAFTLGAEVSFCDNQAQVSGSGRITRVIRPGEKGNAYHTLLGALDPDIEVLYEIDSVAISRPGYNGWIRESMMWKTIDAKKRKVTALPVSKSKALHLLDHVGIDTCSAVSVSTEIADFVYLDTSLEARNSLSLNGVGEGGPTILGRGPMMISTMDENGNQVLMLDPAGVYVKGSEKQSRMRILGQQRMNEFGYNIVQDYKSKSSDLIYRDIITIPLRKVNGILMVKTVPWGLNKEQFDKMEKLVSNVTDSESDHCCFHVNRIKTNSPEMDSCPSLIINEAKLTKEESDRLNHWRHAHRSSSGERYKERCHTCEQAKHKSVFKPNEFYKGTTTSTNTPYFRMYADAYGGQKSMGSESYQGGIGGFVFVCPVSGKIKTKLYSTQEQFPAVLYQILQEIESEGFVCRELYVDTSAVNISAAAEEVAGMYKMRIIEILT